MNVVLFGEPGGEEEARFPLLPDCQVLVVSAGKKSGKKNGISYVPLSAVRDLEPSHGVAMVSHPYWTPFLRQWKPYAVIGLDCDAEASSDPSFHYYRKALNRVSDAVLTDSEEAMLNLNLRGIPAFYAPGPPSHVSKEAGGIGLSLGTTLDEYCVELAGLCKAKANVHDLRRSLLELASHKRKERTDGLLEAIESEPHNESLLALAARYLYAEGRHSEAEHYGFQAFGRCVVANGSRCLSLYRWIAMVQARQGKTEDALNSFGVTAIQAEDKTRYRRLLAAYDQQLHALVCADICRAFLFWLSNHPHRARITHEVKSFDEMKLIYADADIAVIPTVYSEGTSLSCLEAMSSGLPVVATNVGGLNDLILDGYNGRLVPPSAERITAALAELIEDRELRKALGIRARDCERERCGT